MIKMVTSKERSAEVKDKYQEVLKIAGNKPFIFEMVNQRRNVTLNLGNLI